VEIFHGVGFNGNISICLKRGDWNDCDEQECLRLATRHLREVIAHDSG